MILRMVLPWRSLSLLSLPLLAAAGFWHAAFPIAREGQDSAKTQITWLAQISSERDAQLELVKEFERENPDISVRMLWVPPNQYQVKLKTLLAAGLAPDVFTTGDIWLAYMLPFLKDLTGFTERDSGEMDLEDFYPDVRNEMFRGGQCFYVPVSMNVSLLYYNKKLFADGGVEPPTADWTWSDYIDAGQKLTAINAEGRQVWGSTITGGWWGEWLILVRQAGGEIFSEDGRRCLLDTPEAIAGLTFYADKMLSEKISPPAGRGPSTGFASGLYAMSLGGHASSWITYNQVPGLDWDIQVLPAGPAGREGGEVALAAYGMASTTKHPEAAWRFIKFLTSPQAMEQTGGTGLPVRQSVAAKTLLAPDRTSHPSNAGVVYEQLKYARTIPRLPDFIEVTMQIIQPEIDLMLEGRQSPAEAARRATASANAFLDTLAVETKTDSL